MATKAENKEFAAPTKKAQEDRVSVFIPRGDPNGDPNLYVSVNEYTAILPRGKESLVPRAIAEEIRRAQMEENRFYEAVEERGIKPENTRYL